MGNLVFEKDYGANRDGEGGISQFSFENADFEDFPREELLEKLVEMFFDDEINIMKNIDEIEYTGTIHIDNDDYDLDFEDVTVQIPLIEFIDDINIKVKKEDEHFINIKKEQIKEVEEKLKNETKLANKKRLKNTLNDLNNSLKELVDEMAEHLTQLIRLKEKLNFKNENFKKNKSTVSPKI